MLGGLPALGRRGWQRRGRQTFARVLSNSLLREIREGHWAWPRDVLVWMWWFVRRRLERGHVCPQHRSHLPVLGLCRRGLCDGHDDLPSVVFGTESVLGSPRRRS